MIKEQANELVVTLIAGQGASLSPEIVRRIADGVNAYRIDWLSENEAADLFCPAAVALSEVVTQGLAGVAADFFIQNPAKRRKKLLLADMESTIIEQEMLDELAAMIGLRNEVADITRRAMNGELDFPAALRARVALLKSRPVSMIGDVSTRIMVASGAAALIKTMQAHGAQCWLASGGFTCFVEPVAKQLGFDAFFGNELIIRDGYITGEITEPIFDKESKKALIERAGKELNLAPEAILAVGDGANDTPMLAAANENGGLGVAYHAKPQVRRAIAPQINHADLTALLFAQGYTKNDFK